MSTIKKLAGETIIYGMGSILPRLMNFLLIAIYLTFTMDSERYGIHGIMYSFVTVALVIFTLRMETAYFRFGTAEGNDRQKAYSATLSLVLLNSTILMLLMILFRNQIADLLTRPEDSRFVVYFALILFFDAVASVPFASLRLSNRPIKFALIKILNSAFTIMMVLFAFEIMPRYLPEYYNNKLLLDYAFIPNVIASFATLLLLYKELSGFRFSFDRNFWKKLLQYSWPLIIVGIAGGINQFSDRIFVSYLVNPGGEQDFRQSGIFTGAIKIASLMSLFITAFNYAAEPFFFKNSSKESRTTIYGPIALAYTISACALFLFITFNLGTIQYIIGRDFRAGIYIVPVALMSFLVLGIYYNVSIWYKLSGKTIYGAIIAVIGTIVLTIANLILIPKIGMIGANYSSLLCFSTMTILALWLGNKHYPIPYPLWKMLAYIVFAVGLFYLSNTINLQNPMMETIIGNLFLVLFLMVAYFQDFKTLRSI